MRRLSAALAILLMLAGCSEPSPAPADDPLPPPSPAPAAAPFALDCPGGDAEGCSTPLPGGPVAQGEPFVAVDPSDARRMAVATQARSVLVDGDVEAVPVAVYVSNDGGHSWRLTDVPAPTGAANQHAHGDPLVAFGPDGALYMSGLVYGPPIGDVAMVAADIYVARSPDLGTTWSTPVLVTDDQDNDRQWIGVAPDGTLVLTWQAVDGIQGFLASPPSLQAAWSRDGGATWTTATDVTPCFLPSRPLVEGDGFLVACSTSDGPCPTPLYRIAFADGGPVLRGCAREHWCGTNFLARATTERLFLGCLYPPQLAVSEDAGATWSPPEVLSDIAPEAMEGRPFLFWMEVDSAEALHLVTATMGTSGVPGQGGYTHAALVHDGQWRVVSVTPLSAEGPYGGLQNGEFAGIAFGPGAGIVAYVHNDHSVRTLRLVPGV